MTTEHAFRLQALYNLRIIFHKPHTRLGLSMKQAWEIRLMSLNRPTAGAEITGYPLRYIHPNETGWRISPEGMPYFRVGSSQS